MRTLSPALTGAQEKVAIRALAKIVLTHNSDTYTYTKTRVIDIKETEDGGLQSFEVLLHNRDKALTDIDLKGYQGVLSFGARTGEVDDYSAHPPMWVLAQEFDSNPNDLTCTLTLIGIANLMQMEQASENYEPDQDDTESVKDLVDAAIGATLAPFSHCTAYTVEWDAGYDTLADTYIPKDAFRIYTRNNRWSAVQRLLDYTLNVAVVKADGKVHIFKPTTSGTTYDYEYTLEPGDHPFFAKALRNRLVIPNYVKVQSQDGDDPHYSGTATDGVSYPLLPMAHFKQTYLESDAQGTAIAEAILAKAQMWCEAGAAEVPMNVGAEVYDYVKVTDSRESDSRAGNIGKLIRHYNVRKNEWRMTFNFGNWQNIRKVLANLNITADDFENYFSRLIVGDLYVENIYLDEVIDGPDDFRRTKMVAINADGMVILDQVIVGTYDLVLATDISAGHILLSKTVKDGEWYDQSGVEIDATTGINIYGTNNAFTTRATKTGTIQCYVGSDGKIYAGGGKIVLDSLGLWLKGQYMFIQDSGGVTRGHLFGVDNAVRLQANNDLKFTALGDIILDTNSLEPITDDFVDLGSISKQFKGGYFASRLKIPVGTDKYD